MDLITQLKRARATGAPLVAISTADQPATVQALVDGLNGNAPIIQWDLIRGLVPRNDAGKQALAEMIQQGSSFFDIEESRNLIATLKAAAELAPEKTIFLFLNAHRYLDEPAPIQALMNCRDAFKADRRTAILLGPGFRLPAELAQDVLTIDEPLPAPDAIRAVLTALWEENGVTYGPEQLDAATDALRGLAMFPVEQAGALSVNPDKTIDLPGLWDRKRAFIANQPGLTMEHPGETFANVGGLERWKKFQERKFHGRRRPRLIVFVDEGEKVFAAAQGTGDNTGVSQDIHGVFLTEMEDHKYSGAILVGPPGCAKSMIARATAATFGVPLLKMDVGAMKSKHLGDSDQAIRGGWKAVNAIAGDRGAFVIMTSNNERIISPELKRRFRAGIWFFDLPDKAEREMIGQIQAQAYELESIGDAVDFFSIREGWSGANIRDCCEMAYEMDCPLEEAAAFIVPAATQDPQGLDKLRTMAAGRFLSASQPGTYQPPAIKTAPARRRLEA